MMMYGIEKVKGNEHFDIKKFTDKEEAMKFGAECAAAKDRGEGVIVCYGIEEGRDGKQIYRVWR